MRPRRTRRPRAGMSLVELLVACLVLGLIMAALGKLMVSAYDSEEAVQDQNRMQQLAQQAADAVADHLRGSTGLLAGTATDVRAGFLGDDLARYYLQDGALKCDSTRSGQVRVGEVICTDVSALTFTYLRRKPSGAILEVAPSAGVAHALQITVTVASDKERATQTSVVQFRNML